MPKVQRTVLIVDDAKEDRVLIRRALRQDPSVDYHVLEAENGAQALACLRQQQPDCLLLDYYLPDTDGLLLLRTVVQQAAPHIYPVVMLTGVSSTALAVQAMQQGAHDFLSKAALVPEQLHRAVNNATEKVALLRQLEEQREWFRLTLASISDGVIATDVVGCVTFMNPVAEALTGCIAGEAQGQPLDQVFCALAETTRQPLVNPVTDVLRTQQIVNQSNHALLAGRGGRELPIDYGAAPIHDRFGNLIGVVLTFRDVSKRKAAEEALRFSEEFNRTVLESSPDCVKVLDAEGHLLLMNRPGLELMEIDDFIPLYGQPWTTLWPAEYGNQIRDALAVARRGETGRFQGFCPTAKCMPKWWDVLVVAVRDATNEITRFVAVSRDMTESKRTEEALHQQEEMLRQITDNVPGLIGYVGTDERYRFVNAAFETWFQRPRQQIIGSTARALIGDEKDAKLSPYRQQVLTGETVTYETLFSYPDGVTRTVWGRYQPDIAADGAVLGFYLFVIDISERKQAEEALRRANSRFERAEHAANGFVFESDLRTRQVVRSPNFTGVTGYALDEVPPTSDGWTQLIHPDDLARLAEIDFLHSASTQYADEYRVRHKAGHYCWLQEQGIIERDEQGQPVVLIGTTLDITARKQVERNQQLLDAISLALANAADSDALMWAAVSRVGEFFAGLRCGFADIDLATDTSVLHRDWCAAHAISVAETYRNTDFLAPEFMAALTANQAVFVGDVTQDVRTATNAANWAPFGIAAFAFVPILRAGIWQALFYVHLDKPHVWRAAEVQLLHEVAARAWPAVERMRAEEALRASEIRFRTLADAMPQLVWTANSYGSVDYYNVRIDDYDPAVRFADGGFDWSRFVHPDDLAPTFAAWQAAVEWGDPYTFEHRLRMADHSWRWHLSLARPMSLGDNQVKWYGTATDIHERKEIEEALRASEAQLNAILYNMPASVYMLTTDHRYLLVNRIYEQENNISNAEIHGQSVYDRWPAEVAEILTANERQVLTTKAPIEIEEAVQHDGETCYYTTIKAPLLNEAGEPYAIIGISTDITERKRAEEARQQSNAILNAVLESTNDVIFVRDLAGRYLLVNAAGIEQIGMTKQAIIGKSYSEIFSPAEVEVICSEDRPVLAQGLTQTLEHITEHNGVTRYWHTLKMPLRSAAGEIIGLISSGRDFTERKLMEEQLRYHAYLLENMHDAVFATDAQRRIIVWNRGAQALYGWATDEVLGRPVNEVIRSEFTDEQRVRAMQLLATTGFYRDEITVYRRDGTPIATDAVNVALRGADGALTGYLAINRDIRERKQAEEALAAHARELRAITDNIPGLISYVDSEQRYRFANAVYEQWYNQSRNQLIGQHLSTAQGETIYPQLQPYIARALQGEFVQFEATIPYPDGVRIVWATYVPNLDDQGVVHGFYALVTDISARKRVEEQLRLARDAAERATARVSQLQTFTAKLGETLTYEQVGHVLIAEVLPIAGANAATLAVLDETGREFRLTGQSGISPERLHSWQRFPVADGIPMADAVRQLDLILLPDRESALARYPSLASDATPEHQAWAIIPCLLDRRAVGALVLSFAAVQVFGPDECALLLAVGRLCAQALERARLYQVEQQARVELEARVQQRTAELTKRLRELDQFAYVTSHDLKSPLRAIDHLAHWISDDAGDLLPAKSRGHLEKMRGRIVRMEKLLDDLLAYSRADRFEYRAEQVDLALLLDNVIRLVTPPQGFTVSVQTPLPMLLTQKVPLETVLRNLINNAIKHHDRSDGEVQVTVQDLGEFLEFNVSDDGPGIASEFHERIFQVFQTLKPRDQVEGSGMGLAIVKKIVESHNGSISVISTRSQGATFRFIWPKG